jgi:aspartyl aminopeptidase
MDSLDDLITFLSSSPTPYHAVASATARLLAAGFEPLAERDAWESLGAGRYYVVHEGSAVVAFVVPEGAISGYRIVGAHTSTQRRATCSSASRCTAARCSTPGSTGTWGSRGACCSAGPVAASRHAS